MSSKLPFISPPIRSLSLTPSIPSATKHSECKIVNGVKVMYVVDDDKKQNQQSKQTTSK